MPNATPNAALPKRRWYRYGLWSLPILLVLGGILAVRYMVPPYSLETRIAFFNRNRAKFDAYVQRILSGQVKIADAQYANPQYAVPQFMISKNVKQVGTRDGCIEITFWFMPVACCDPAPRLAAVMVAFSPLGSTTHTDPGQVSSAGMIPVVPLPPRDPPTRQTWRSSI